MPLADEPATSLAAVGDRSSLAELAKAGNAHDRAFHSQTLQPRGGKLTTGRSFGPAVVRSPLILGMAAVFAGCTVVLTVTALAYREPLVLIVAAPFAISTYLFWFQATGGLAARARRRAVRGQSSVGATAGGRAQERGADRRVTGRAGGGRSAAGRGPGRGAGGRGTGGRSSDPGPSEATARRVLGVAPDADAEAIRAAYRDRVKEVHPDADSGTEEAFRRVQAAYDRLQD